MRPLPARLFFIASSLIAAFMAAIAIAGARLLYTVGVTDSGGSLGSILSTFAVLAILVAGLPPLVTLVPIALAILAAEILVLRSWLYFSCAGALSALVARYTSADGGESGFPAGLALAAGGAGGLVYWQLAGRSAGTANSGENAQ